MKHPVIAAGLVIVLLAALSPAYQQQPAKNQTSTLKIGDMAPDLTLPDGDGKPVKLSSFKGAKNVVLAFYPKAFTGG